MKSHFLSTAQRNRWIGLFLFGLAAIIPRAAAQSPAGGAFKDIPVLPEGPKGARIRSFIEVINSGTPALIRPYLEREFTAGNQEEMDVNHLIDIQRDSGGIDFCSIRVSHPERPAETEVIVRDRALGLWYSYTFEFGPAPEFRFSSWMGRPALPPAGIEDAPLTENEAVAEIRALTDRLAARGWLSGAVLVAKGADVLLTAAAGEADRAVHIPNRLDTKFYLGRMNRMFTATAIARLAESGKISFDDPIGKYIDETWLPKAFTDKITVRHLMAETSGLKSFPNGSADRKSDGDFFRKLEDFKPLVRKVISGAAPGERFLSSNTDMFLLGVIIEKVTGESYDEHIRKTISLPLGMRSTDCYEMDDPVENLAIGYRYEWTMASPWRSNLFLYPPKGGPAGGGYATVGDLHKFSLALLSGNLVSRPMLETLWTASPGTTRGCGFRVAQGPAGKVVGYNGMISCLNINVDSKYIVAVMFNDGKDSFQLATRIGGILARVQAR